MKSNKTFSVKKFKESINLKLTLPTLSAECKAGLCQALESVLIETGNYKGYNFIYWLEKGCDEWREAGFPGSPEKEKFIYGPGGSEWDRVYY